MAYFKLVDLVAEGVADFSGLPTKTILGYVEAESRDKAGELLNLGEPDGGGEYRPNSHSVYALQEIESPAGFELVRNFKPYEPW